ncbi:MAG: hypothetical protein WCI00_00455 [bacterium]
MVPLSVILPDPLGTSGVVNIRLSNIHHEVVVCVVGIGLAEPKFNVPGQ